MAAHYNALFPANVFSDEDVATRWNIKQPKVDKKGMVNGNGIILIIIGYVLATEKVWV